MAQNKTQRDETDANGSRMATWVIMLLLLLGLVVIVFGLTMNGDDEETASVESTESSSTEEADETADTESAENNEPASASPDTTVEETDSTYQYVAGSGESFTALARRSIAAMDGSLSTAERVAAETKLAQDADAAYLEVGQAVRLDKETIAAAIDWAKNLSAEQKAAWQPYADLVAWN